MSMLRVACVLAVLWLTQVLGRINLVTDSGQSIVSFLTLATLILPTVIPTVLPFGIVLGTAQTQITCIAINAAMLFKQLIQLGP